MFINALYNRARTGDKADENLLFEKLTVSFETFVGQRIRNRDDAKEVVQEALTAIAGKYRDIEFETSFSAWAYKVLENKLFKYFRSQQRSRIHVAEWPETEFPAPTMEVDPLLRRQLLDCLKKVSATKIRHARILYLHFQGYSIEEICSRLGVTPNNLYVMLYRARSMLKTCLEKGDIK